MTEDCAQRLQLTRTPASMRLNRTVSSIVSSKIQSPCVPTFEVKAAVRPNLSKFFPTHSLKVKGCFQSRSINLADPEFMLSRPPNLKIYEKQQKASKYWRKNITLKLLEPKVRWNPNPDTFTFKVNLDDIRSHTK